MAVMSRKRSVDYDKIMRRQRDLIYATRDHLLDGGDVDREQILQMAEKNIRRFFGACESIDKKILSRYILDNISYRLENDLPDTTSVGLLEIEEYLLEKVVKRLEDREKNLGVRDMNTFIRVAVLSAIDNAWVEQVDYMHQLQAAVSGRSTAQRNLLFEYQNECFDAFEKMENTVFETAMRSIMLSNVYVDEERKLHIVFP